MVSLPATLLPQAPSPWISEPCRDPPPILVLTPGAGGNGGHSNDKRTCTLLQTAWPFHIVLPQVEAGYRGQGSWAFPTLLGGANPFTGLEVEAGIQPGAVPSAGTTPPENWAEQ